MNKQKMEQTVEFYTRYLEFVKTVDDNLHHSAVMYAVVNSNRIETDESDDVNVNAQDVELKSN